MAWAALAPAGGRGSEGHGRARAGRGGTDGAAPSFAIAQLPNRHNTAGEDLVAMCVDDIVPMGAEPCSSWIT